jgi:predicted anti-sigma-YlaC factor YlaD
MNMPKKPSHHLSEDTLFEYLDQALSEQQAAEIKNHLDACPDCQGHYANLKALFTTLEDLPDEPIQADLTPNVLTAIKRRQKSAPIWWWSLIIQGILALGLIAIAVPSLIDIPTFSLLENGKEILTTLSASLGVWLRALISTFDEMKQQTSQLLAIRLPISLNLPMQSILWLLLLATITGVVGNSILLRPNLWRTER